jgi:hypothetical protein
MSLFFFYLFVGEIWVNTDQHFSVTVLKAKSLKKCCLVIEWPQVLGNQREGILEWPLPLV